jgi:hypothetical protein
MRGGGQVSALMVGLSHKNAPVTILERTAVSGDALAKLLVDLVRAEPVAEAFVLSTCNRVEVYADVDRFHAGVATICELLARHSGLPEPELARYLYSQATPKYAAKIQATWSKVAASGLAPKMTRAIGGTQISTRNSRPAS